MKFPWKLFKNSSAAKVEQRALEPDDLEDLPSIERCSSAQPEFQSEWYESLASGKDTSFTYLIMRHYKKELLLGAFLRLSSDLSNVCMSLILRQIIYYLDDYHNYPSYTGYLYSVALAAANTVAIMGLAGSTEVTAAMFQRIRSALTCMVFEKSLRLHSDHGQQGAIVAMHSTDTAKLKELMFLHGLLVSPITIAANMAAMYLFIGPAGLVSLVALIILLLIQTFVSSKTGGVIHQAHIHSDERLKAVTEAILGIRVCKFMNWEEKVAEKIAGIRALEVLQLKKMYTYRSIIAGISHSVHMLLLLAVFGVAYASGEPVSAASVFPAMALLNTIPKTVIAFGFGRVVDMVVSLRRLETFFKLPEKPSAILPLEEKLKALTNGPLDDNTEIEEAAFVIENVTAGFNVDDTFTPILKDLNVIIPKDKLTIITGPTGSAKSTFINALMGECRFSDESKIYCSGDVAYVSQEAWIMNATVRNNILMGLPFDENKYMNTAVACQLLADFDQFSEGDATEIGERGVNLSGGQKQRIAFARAVYSGKQIIVMDDPLAAVDSHVCRALFEECIAGEILEDRTRILVTHQTQFLDMADQIVVFKERKISFTGTYEELLDDSANSIVFGTSSPVSSGSRRSFASSTFCRSASSFVTSPSGVEKLIPMSPITPKPAKKKKLMAEEEQNIGNIGADVYKWLSRLAGPGNVVLLFCAFALWRASLLIVDVFLGMWSNKIGGFGKDSYTEAEYFYWFVITTVIGLVLVTLRGFAYNRCVGSIAENTHGIMVDRLLHAPISFFDTTPVGRMLSRFSKDMRVMDMIVSDLTLFSLTLIFLALGYITIILISAVYLVVLVLALSIIYGKLQQWYSYSLRAVKRVENVERSPMMAIMSESLGGIVTIRAYGLESMMSETHARRVDGMMRALYNGRMANLSIMAIVAMMGSFIIFATAVMAVVFVTESAAAVVSPDSNLVTLGLTYSTVLTNVFGFLLLMSSEVDASMNAAERLKSYAEDIPQERAIEYSTGNGPDEEYPAPPENWPSSGRIKFNKVSLSYRAGLPLVLKGISIDIESGEKVGIVGRTGSGKSTIMLALFRLVELAAGQLFIDDFDISGLKLGDLRSNITIIPQDPVLFQGTVRTNLDPFGKFDDEELLEIVHKVGMGSRIEQEGLDTPVSDKGANFSVGQRQLLCLGRAILKRCRVLLLDEATASVDFECDAMIQDTIRNEFKDCTVLTIAHRLATVIDNDKILVLDEGNVVEFDHPKVLLDNHDGAFCGMVRNLGEEQHLELYNASCVAFDDKHSPLPGLHSL